MPGFHGAWSLGSFAGAGSARSPSPPASLSASSCLSWARSRCSPPGCSPRGCCGRRGTTCQPQRPRRRARRCRQAPCQARSALVRRDGPARRDRLRRDAVRGRYRRLSRGLPVRPAAHHRRGPRPRLRDVRAGHGHRPAVRQPAAHPLPARPAAARAGRVRDGRIRCGPAHRRAAGCPPRVRLPRHWPGIRSSSGVQCRRADTRPCTGHRRGHRVSMRMGRIPLRPTGHRAPVRMGVAARRLGLLPLLIALVAAGTFTSPALCTGRQLRARAQCAAIPANPDAHGTVLCASEVSGLG